MKNRKITYDWIAQPHGTKQNDPATIIDIVLVDGNTKYIIETAHGEIKQINPIQVDSVLPKT